MAKIDRKAQMRRTLENEKKSTEDRFARAEQVLDRHPRGLANPAVVPAPILPAASFSAENTLPSGRLIVTALLGNVQDNPYNARHIYNQDVIKSLAASLATHGQMVPATAIRHPTVPGEYILIDGHYRKKALQHAGKDSIELMLQEQTSTLDMYRNSWLLNEERSAQSALDNAYSWRALLDQGLVHEDQEIADLVGVSKATVSRTLSLLQLPASALEKVSERPEKFGVAIGYELAQAAKHLEEASILELLNRVVNEDLSSRAVEAIRKKLESGQERKTKEVSRQYKIRKDAAQIGFIKEWDSGKVMIEIHVDDPKERESLVEEFKKRFNTDE